MTTAAGVLVLMEERGKRPAAVLNRFKLAFDISDKQIGEHVGLKAPEVQMRRKGKRGISPAQITGFADLFAVPEQVFFMTEAEAIRYVVEHDPEFTAPWRSTDPGVTHRYAHRPRDLRRRLGQRTEPLELGERTELAA